MPAEPDQGESGGWDSDDNAGGYIVTGTDAVKALLDADKTEAALYWGSPVPPKILRFGADYCEVVST